MRRIVLAIVAMFAFLTLPCQTQASLVLYLNTVFSGDTPAGTSPYATATFTTTGVDTVQLQMATTGLADGQSIGAWYFNVDPTLGTLTFANVSGEIADSITQDADNLPADGGGFYDIRFSFPEAAADKFTAPGTSVYDISGTGLDENDFAFLAAPHGGNGVYFSAIHVQQVPLDGEEEEEEGSAWVGAGLGPPNPGPPPPIPEPATFVIYGALLALAAAAVHYSRRRAH